MTFWKTVGAYLTGWLIVQPIYNRLLAYWREREMANPSAKTRWWFEQQAKANVKAAGRCYTSTEVRGLALRAAMATRNVRYTSYAQNPDEMVRAVDEVLRVEGVLRS